MGKVRTQSYSYRTVQDAAADGDVVQSLSNGFGVKTLKSNPDKTVTLNGTTTMTLTKFHSLGGMVALFHGPAIYGGPFMRFTK